MWGRLGGAFSDGCAVKTERQREGQRHWIVQARTADTGLTPVVLVLLNHFIRDSELRLCD